MKRSRTQNSIRCKENEKQSKHRYERLMTLLLYSDTLLIIYIMVIELSGVQFGLKS